MYTKKINGFEFTVYFAEKGPSLQEIIEKDFRAFLDNRALYGPNGAADGDNRGIRQEMALASANTS